MILCVTPNPALDRTLIVKNFAKGGVFRPQESMVAAGGKGLDVARPVQTLAGQPVCAGFLGGFSGSYLAEMVEKLGVEACWTWLNEQETRTCVILIDPETLLTSVINEAGPQLVDSDWAQLREDLRLAGKNASLISFSGSLPSSSSPDAFAALVEDLRVGQTLRLFGKTSANQILHYFYTRAKAICLFHPDESDFSSPPRGINCLYE